MNETTKPIEMIPLKDALTRIGYDGCSLNGRSAVYEHEGIYRKGILVVHHMENASREYFVAFKPNQGELSSQYLFLGYLIFWPKACRPKICREDPSRLNLEGCFVEYP
ncbi:MAG: hypothetical protein AAB824_00475 [Patescibacteria group bacterium]